jgi:hypothetical protein
LDNERSRVEGKQAEVELGFYLGGADQVDCIQSSTPF